MYHSCHVCKTREVLSRNTFDSLRMYCILARIIWMLIFFFFHILSIFFFFLCPVCKSLPVCLDCCLFCVLCPNIHVWLCACDGRITSTCTMAAFAAPCSAHPPGRRFSWRYDTRGQSSAIYCHHADIIAPPLKKLEYNPLALKTTLNKHNTAVAEPRTRACDLMLHACAPVANIPGQQFCVCWYSSPQSS